MVVTRLYGCHFEATSTDGSKYTGDFHPFSGILTIQSDDNFHAEISSIDERQARRLFVDILNDVECYVK